MTKNNVMQPLARANAFVAAAVIASASLLPVLLLTGNASGAQLGDRSIDMSANLTSEGSGRDSGDSAGKDVTYRVDFDLTTAHTVEGIVIDFCSAADTPIIGDTCATPSGFDLDIDGAQKDNDGTGLAFTEVSALLNANWGIDTVNSDANTLILVDDTTAGDALSAAANIVFDLGTAAAADGIYNPDVAGTFYARITTFTNDTVASAYDSVTPGAFTDEGGIALSVANELTITARVQEVLEFCIGTQTTSTLDTAALVTGDDCGDVAGTALSLGVVDSTSVQQTTDGDLDNNGIAMIRTNAARGAGIFYKAEQASVFKTNGGAGTLSKTGAGTDDCGTIASVANSCFNSAGGDVTNPTAVAISFGTERFGMTLHDLKNSADVANNAGGATNNLACDGNYDGDGSCGSGVGASFAWDPTGAFDTIAAATAPLDDELVEIEFAATASPTTPTGLYTVTANFVATALF